jgi:RNA polymerase sigma factor (sigma-70 family)
MRSTANTIHPDAELDELFSFHDDPDFLVAGAQGRAELRQLVLKGDTLRDETTTRLQAAELGQRAAQGDPEAWQEIMRRYSGLVAAKVRAFRLQDADAREAIETTWLRLAENIHRIQHLERLGGWLATTATRECLHILYRAHRTTPIADTSPDTTTEPPPAPEQHTLDSHTAHTLWQLIATLPPRQRQLLQQLFTDQPPSYAELAAKMNIPVGSIGPTRNRALRRLRQMLHDHVPRTEQ